MGNEKLKILRMLIENQTEEFSIRQIGIQRKINYKSAYLNLKSLEANGVVNLRKYGNITLCSFNRKFDNLVFEAERIRLHDLLKDKNLLVLYNRLAKTNGQFILLLFGSYAHGRQTKGSDIDLLLISNSPKPVETQIKLLPLNIHLTPVTYDEFESMLKSREFTVISEAVKHNILLFGTEDYYRLINRL